MPVSDFIIVALNELNEPFNSNSVYDTPNFVNVNEEVNFFYYSSSGIALKGNEHWVWDFDYGQNNKDNNIQSFIGFDTPYSVSFSRFGERKVSVNVFDSIQKSKINLEYSKKIDTVSSQSIFNENTNHLLSLNTNTDSIDIIDIFNDTIVGNIVLSDKPKKIVYCELYERFYVSLENGTIDIVSALSETVSESLDILYDINDLIFDTFSNKLYIIGDNIHLVSIEPILNEIEIDDTILYSTKLFTHNNKIYLINNNDDSITVYDTVSLLFSYIYTSNNPLNLSFINNVLYVRCLNNLDVSNVNITSISNTISTNDAICSDIIFNNINNELYIVSNNIIESIDILSFTKKSKKYISNSVDFLYFDYTTNSLLFYDNKLVVLDTIDFNIFLELPNNKINYFYKTLNKIYYSVENLSLETIKLLSSSTNTYVDGDLIYSDIKTFNVFAFPSNIEGVEYISENQLAQYSTQNVTNFDAEKYQWFVNGVLQNSVVNYLSFPFTNLIKANISVNVINGRMIKKYSFLTSLSVGSSVIGEKYDDNIVDKLKFFNKEGDYLNFEYIEDDINNPYWSGDMIFDSNSNDTFKTLGLYILEDVKPLSLTSEYLEDRKCQIFNENGLDIQGGDENIFYITKIEAVNKNANFYTKWLYCDGIENKIKIGSEIILNDFNDVNLDTDSNIIDYTTINDLYSFNDPNNTELYTVLAIKKGAIMVNTETSNDLFVNKYGYGDYRKITNNIVKVNQGYVELKNIVKTYNINDYSSWNEPLYKSLFYDDKKISIINSQKNDGVYTIDYKKPIINKFIKNNIVNITDILPNKDFSISLETKTNKISLGSNNVNFFPSSSNIFLNNKSFLVWDSDLKKDFTPALLKKGISFVFEQTPTIVDNLNYKYYVENVDKASNILEYQTTEKDGWKIVLNTLNNFKDYSFNFTINTKSNYTITENVHFRIGNNVNETASNIAYVLDSFTGITNGLSVISVNNEIYIYEIKNYSFVMNTVDNVNFTTNKGILNTNSPAYGVVGNEWVQLNDDAFNGYIHYRALNDNYYVYYFGEWIVIPANKKIVWTSQKDNLDTDVNIDLQKNILSEAHLDNNKIVISQQASGNNQETTSMLVENFVLSNRNTFNAYGLDINIVDNKLIINNLYSTKSLNIEDDYVNISVYSDNIILNKTISGEEIDMFFCVEQLNTEFNRKNGYLYKNNKISNIWRREIVIKDINVSSGLIININGVDYTVSYNNNSVNSILNVEDTLKSFGNQKHLDKPYHEFLELEGVLMWLEQSETSMVDNVHHYDTIVLESKYPNVDISYKVNGTYNEHYIKHSNITFKTSCFKIGRSLSLTINNVVYSENFDGSISNTLINFVSKWETSLFNNDIVIYSKDDVLYIGTLDEKTQIKYSVNVGLSPILGNPFYIIETHRKGNDGIVLSGNEIRNNNINLETYGFSTAMIMILKNSKYFLNNQEYNIIFLDPSIIGLSYQGAFWNNEEPLGDYIIRSSGFNWNNMIDIDTNTNISNGYFSTAGITELADTNDISCMYVDYFNDLLWVGHNNSFNGTINVYDINDYTLLSSFTVSNNPNSIVWNPINNKIYISNKGSNRVVVINPKTYSLTDTIPVGITPIKMVIDTYTNYMFVINSDSENLSIINLFDNTVSGTIALSSNPIDMCFDKINKLLYIICADNTVSIIDSNRIVIKTLTIGLNPKVIILDKNNKVFISVENGLNIISYENNNFDMSFYQSSFSNNNLLTYNASNDSLYLVSDNMIEVIDSVNIIKKSVVFAEDIIKNILIVPFANSLFYTMPNINKIGIFDVNDNLYITNKIDVGSFSNIITCDNNTNTVFVGNGDIINILNQVPYTNNSTSGIVNNKLSISTREFLRFPRERYSEEGNPIYFKFSWEDDKDNSMFMYDFSGKQLFVEKDGKRILNYNSLNYVGKTPLLNSEGNSFLNKNYNTDISEIYNPIKQQTIFDNIYYDLDYIDSETDLDPRPVPMQLFVGYNSNYEGFNSRRLIIERIENISLNINTDLNVSTNSYENILNFENNSIVLTNSKINFIDYGFKVGQFIQFSGFDKNSSHNQSTFNNAGFIGKIISITIDRIVFDDYSVNKKMITESTLTKTYSIIPPFKSINSTLHIKMEVLPSVIAKIDLKASTEIEDERFNTILNNFGYNIKHKDVFIFKDYDIKENGIDWIYLNEKRKEMLVNYTEIYNYIGSYKALINSVKFFGYNDLELYEYYLNVDKKSDHYNKLHKIEINDIFDTTTQGYTPTDYVIQSLPNSKYQKTKLFNITYRITDIEGNYILGYSLDEVITKLIGLKKWLKDNIIPVGTRILDLTGRGDTSASNYIWHDVKTFTKFSINKSLTPVDFKVETYLQPVDNGSKTHNVNISFFTKNDFKNDYFVVNIKTYSLTNKLYVVQNLKYYKSDMLSLNFACDLNIDPYINIEVLTDNGESNYIIKKNFLLSNTKLITLD